MTGRHSDRRSTQELQLATHCWRWLLFVGNACLLCSSAHGWLVVFIWAGTVWGIWMF